MSDIEDLEKIVEVDARERTGSPKRIQAGLQNCGRFLGVKARRNAKVTSSALWLSAREPSLPRLKFLEGKDE